MGHRHGLTRAALCVLPLIVIYGGRGDATSPRTVNAPIRFEEIARRGKDLYEQQIRNKVETEQNIGKLSRIRREIDIEGPLNDQDRQRLVEIADRCPVHRTLSAEIAFETTEA